MRSYFYLVVVKGKHSKSVIPQVLMLHGGGKKLEDLKEKWQPFEKDREIAETIHTMNNTKEAFRLVVQRWPKLRGELFDPEPYSYHVVATNREEEAPEIVHLHNQRGQMENFILLDLNSKVAALPGSRNGGKACQPALT